MVLEVEIEFCVVQREIAYRTLTGTNSLLELQILREIIIDGFNSEDLWAVAMILYRFLVVVLGSSQNLSRVSEHVSFTDPPIALALDLHFIGNL